MYAIFPDSRVSAEGYVSDLEEAVAGAITLLEREDAAREIELAEQDFAERVAGTSAERTRRWTQDQRLEARMDLVAEACTSGPMEYDYADVRAWYDRADRVARDAGIEDPAPPRLGVETLMEIRRVEIVPNAPFRDAYLQQVGSEDEDVKLSRLAQALGGEPEETTWVRRLLGLEPHGEAVRIFIDHDHAVALCHALKLDPYTCGI